MPELQQLLLSLNRTIVISDGIAWVAAILCASFLILERVNQMQVRFLCVAILALSVFFLSSCTGPQDAMIAQSNSQALQAQANANTLQEAIQAVDKAGDRQAAQMVFLNLIVASLLILFAVGVYGFWKWQTGQVKPGYPILPKIDYDQLSGYELRLLAVQLGYLVGKDADGKWAIVNRNSLKRLNKEQLLLEIKSESR